ncbi:MAG: carboxyl transferase domain-containing protein [Pseudomonadota bacterium]
MAVFASKLNVQASGFAENRKGMLALVERMRALEARAVEASEKRKSRFRERGQLTPRERVAQLLDPGMPFLELHNMANYLVEETKPEKSVPGASSILGIGFVSGARCMIGATDSGIAAGAATPMSVAKAKLALDVALRQKLPYIQLVESAGANLMTYTVELWAEGGYMFYGLAKLSAAGVPTMTVLHGPSTAGGAYQPGMSDYVIGVKRNGMAALAGAALTKAATGEVSDDRDLGGSEMHASVSGLVEYLAEDDGHGLAIAREVVDRLDWNASVSAAPPGAFAEPLYDPDEIAGLVPLDYKTPYDARELVARLVDGSDFTEFKPRFGPSTLCLQAKIYGHEVGIIANNGPIDPNAAAKCGHFVQLCDQAGAALVFLSNVTGYMVGVEAERAGMIKHGAKMIQAVSNARAPKLSIYVGASFGAGNYGMCGYAYDPDFLFTWPNAQTGVMAGDSAAGTMAEVARGVAARKGMAIPDEMIEAQSNQLKEMFDRQHDAFYTSGRCLDHGMIDPRDTRRVLGFCLQTCWEARNRTLRPNAFGVARL